MDDSKAEKDQFLKQIASLESKLTSQDHLQKEYSDLRSSYNALKTKFDDLNRSKGKSPISNLSTPKVSVSKKVYTGESSRPRPFSKKVSQFATYSLQKGRKFTKKPRFSETPTPPKLSRSNMSHEETSRFQTPQSRFTWVRQVWRPKQSPSNSEKLPLQNKNDSALKKIFKSPLIPRVLFPNEKPVFSPRWNSTSLNQIDTTYKWIAKHAKPIGAVLKWVPKVVV